MDPLVSTLNLKKPSSAYFDADAAKRAVDFFSLLPHVKGKWAGQGFKLEPWQESIVSALFGWRMSKGGPRLYRECYLEVPRKQGKGLELRTPILTTRGWKTMATLAVG